MDTTMIKMIVAVCAAFCIVSFPIFAENDEIETVEETQETVEASNAQSDERGSEPVHHISMPADCGIADGFSFGGKVLFALGSVEKAQREGVSQSPAGFSLFSLIPVSAHTQVRIHAGIPLWHVRKAYIEEEMWGWDSLYYQYLKVATDKRFPDPYFSAEHAWGWEKIGFSLGLAYLSAQRFTRDIWRYEGYYPYDTTHTRYKYETDHFFNCVVSVRGGRPRGGFFGKVSFPLAIALDESRRNYFIEYSVFGAFGVKNTKFGIGHMGAIKSRESDSVMVSDYYSRHIHKEMYMLFPCLKIAQLFGDHVVANLNFELGGIIIPRMDFQVKEWRPSIGVDFLFSLGKLKSPSIMDGTF